MRCHPNYPAVMRILYVVGARPNIVKVAPLIAASDRASITSILVHTGQHYDEALDSAMFRDLGLRSPDHRLEVGSGSHATQTARIMLALEPILSESLPDLMVVVGDTNSALACALVAAKLGLAIAHVEAGLRSGDWSMPEEVNRVLVDRMSRLLFAPSDDALENLESEGVPSDRIHLVGNVMIDSLIAALPAAKRRTTVQTMGLEAREFGLVTLHRPANVDDEQTLAAILGALDAVADRLPLVLPVHPRVRKLLEQKALPEKVRLVEPLGYLDFLCLEANAAIVLTDSGGVQEETTVLGIPCLTLRTSTERPVTITEGTNRLVVPEHDQVIAAVDEALASPPPARHPALWDGMASDRITKVLVDYLGSSA